MTRPFEYLSMRFYAVAVTMSVVAFQSFRVMATETEKESPIPEHVATKPADRLAEDWWKERHERFNNISQQGEAELVFLGDSITQSWEGPGNEVWKEYYADRKAANFGNSGDRTEHVLWRLNHGNFKGLSPKLIVMLIGTNNIGHRSSTPEQAADGIRAIIHHLQERMPKTQILLLGVLPRGEEPDDEMRKLAAKINEHAKDLGKLEGVHYLDIGDRFVQKDGTISKEIMPDFLHLSPQGYKRWAEAIEPTVSKILGDEKRSEE